MRYGLLLQFAYPWPDSSLRHAHSRKNPARLLMGPDFFLAWRCTVNFRRQSLQKRSGRSPKVAVCLTPLLLVLALPQYGHFGFLPRFLIVVHLLTDLSFALPEVIPACCDAITLASS